MYSFGVGQYVYLNRIFVAVILASWLYYSSWYLGYIKKKTTITKHLDYHKNVYLILYNITQPNLTNQDIFPINDCIIFFFYLNYI